MIRLERQFALAMLIGISPLPTASAQGPHSAAPGTICVTPQGSCPAVRPGPPGAPCACKTASGWVQGVLK